MHILYICTYAQRYCRTARRSIAYTALRAYPPFTASFNDCNHIYEREGGGRVHHATGRIDKSCLADHILYMAATASVDRATTIQS